MKYVFNTLSIGENHTRDYTLKLARDILDKTNHDLLVTTDAPEILTNEYSSPRIKIHKVDRSKLRIRLYTNEALLGSDFNFNLKYLCFEQLIGTDYDFIINTDCDNSVEWFEDGEVDEYLNERLVAGYDFHAPRAEWKVEHLVADWFKNPTPGSNIMWHKIVNYGITQESAKPFFNASLPAEHVLVLQNDKTKLEKFYLYWKEMHDHLCALPYTHGTWAEGYEIGVASYKAGYNMCDIGWNHRVIAKMVKYNTYKIGHQSEFD
jgi:hypothetical protein